VILKFSRNVLAIELIWSFIFDLHQTQFFVSKSTVQYESNVWDFCCV